MPRVGRLLRFVFGFVAFAGAAADRPWAPADPPRAAPCTIPRVPAADMGRERFLREYLDRRPVIIVGGRNNSAIRAATARPALLAAYGTAPVPLSTAHTYSYSTADLTLREYVTERMAPQPLTASGLESEYHFGGHAPAAWGPLLALYHRPGYAEAPSAPSTLAFGIAAHGTGVPFHVHGDGFSEVLHGYKRWFLYPPGQEPRLQQFAGLREQFFDPNASTLQWVTAVYPQLAPAERPLECVIGPDEALYFPTRWYHATLNVGETIFLSTFT